MITIKTEEEIKIMQTGGKILKDVLRILFDNVKEGVKLSDIDKLAEKEITERGGLPSFKKVKGYRWTICGCVNEVVVHGIPGDYRIRDGDVVGIDCGVYYKGFHTDSAHTIRINTGNRKKDEIDTFLEVGESALKKAIMQVQLGKRIYDISKTISENIEKAGYSVVRNLVGHGVGKNLHEEPEIPGFVSKKRENTPELKKGMTLAIEVIYNIGTPEILYDQSDGWTIVTKDGKISGLFEATVALTSHGCIVLT
jgi:methionyl aminopeptidase